MQNNVLDYLDTTIKRVPEKTAFADDDISYTFLQVYEQSRSIGTCLSQKGYYREPVLVFMKKSPKTVTAFFGVVHAGCFYVPVSEAIPNKRIQLILENCGARVIICDKHTQPLAHTLSFDGEILCYDMISQHPEDSDCLCRIRRQAIDTDPIYIVFTSGSTGTPKGVCACHRSVIDYVEQLSDVLGFSEETIFGNQTPLYFDACLKELYPTLKFGATTYLIPQKHFMFPVKLIEYLNEKKINTICWVVSALTMISSFQTFDTIKPKYLHTIAFGSEVFPLKQFKIWKKALPDTAFFNLYGPTEGTGMCCYYPVTRELSPTEVIPIGYPFKNTEILLLNEENKPAVENEAGEICIRGTSVTLGYYNNPEKTNSAFVQNPLNSAYPEIIYRTGDIGRKNEYGELVFLSRRDNQIKHMGHRVELGEIEADVNGLEKVRFSCCIYDENKNKIILYYVGEMETPKLTRTLKELLPRYMMPNHIIRLDEMPFTANGKIDRNALKIKYKKIYEMH